MWILLAILGFLLVILLWPVCLNVTYQGELKVRARVLGIPFTVFSEKKAAKKPAPAKTAGPVAGPKRKLLNLSRRLKEDGLWETVSFLKELAAIILKGAQKLFRAAWVRSLKLDIQIGGEDAAKTAMNYGKVSASVYPALEIIGGFIRIGKKKILLTPDFVTGTSGVQFAVKIWVCPVRALWAGLWFLVRFSRQTSPPPANGVYKSKKV